MGGEVARRYELFASPRRVTRAEDSCLDAGVSEADYAREDDQDDDAKCDDQPWRHLCRCSYRGNGLR